MLDYCAEYHHQYGAFLCVRVQVQNLGEPGPVVTSLQSIQVMVIHSFQMENLM
jgi:hypothetical protein